MVVRRGDAATHIDAYIFAVFFCLAAYGQPLFNLVLLRRLGKKFRQMEEQFSPADVPQGGPKHLIRRSKPLSEYGSAQLETVSILPAQRQLTGVKRSFGNPIAQVSG